MTEQKKRILAVTLARGGSKSIPLKNIASIAGVPLIAYTIAEAQKSNWISRYIISTDSEQIKSVAELYGAEVPFLRPAVLSGDKVPSLQPLQHAVQWAEEQEGQQYDYVIELMATNPLKTAFDIDAVLDKLISTNAESVIGVSELGDHHPARIKKIIDDRIVDFCIPEAEVPRQDLRPKAYIRNGAIYAMRRDVLMVQSARYGTPDSRPYIFPEERSVNVDSRLDFLVAAAILKENPRNIATLNEMQGQK